MPETTISRPWDNKMYKFFAMIVVNFLSTISLGIAFIVFPWVIADLGASKLLILANSTPTLVLIFFNKKLAHLIDSFSKQKTLATNMVLLAIILAIASFSTNNLHILLVCYSFIQFYMYFFYVCRSSIAQELGDANQYSKINAVLEVEGLVSYATAGSLAAWFLGKISISQIFLLSVCPLVLAVAVLMIAIRVPQKSTTIQENISGAQKYDKQLLLLCMGATVPFAIVAVLAVLNPLIMVNSPGMTAQTLALMNVSYTIGAFVAAGVMWQISKHIAEEKIIFVISIGFLLTCTVPFISFTWLTLICASFGWGLCNVIARIAWQTKAMKAIPSQSFGGFFSHLEIFGLAAKLILLTSMLAFGGTAEAVTGFVYIIIAAFIGLLMTSTSVTAFLLRSYKG